jgi:hypothetical protein
MILGSANLLRVRMEAAFGIVATVLAIWLGAVWPSLLTLLALPLLPAPLIFFRYLLAPSGLNKHPYLRLYLISAACLGVASILFEAWWLTTHTTGSFG